jgi:hypothetical protein
MTHTDLPAEQLDMLREHKHVVAIAFFGLELHGMWLNFVDDIPIGYDEEDNNKIFLDLEAEMDWEGVEWKMASNMDRAKSVVEQSKRSPPTKLDGKYVFIPFGQVCIIPADLYHSGGIRTSPTGNRRAHCYVYAENPDAALKINDIINKQEKQQGYMDVRKEHKQVLSHVDLREDSEDWLKSPNAVKFRNMFVL